MTNKYEEYDMALFRMANMVDCRYDEDYEALAEYENKLQELIDNYAKMEKAIDKMAYLLTNAEKDSCYYCPLSRSGESLDEIKKKCIAKGGVICLKEDWKEWVLKDEDTKEM